MPAGPSARLHHQSKSPTVLSWAFSLPYTSHLRDVPAILRVLRPLARVDKNGPLDSLYLSISQKIFRTKVGRHTQKWK
jgi:hypothetical protein